MNNSDNEYQIIINKIDLLGEKLELYKQTNDERLDAVRSENKAYQDSMRAEIKAYQDANKQQLNVNLGVLVTAAVAILVSLVISR
jgi:hypothetical protein